MHTTAHHHVAVRKTDRHRKIGREPLEEEAAKVITQTTGKMDDGSAGWIFDYSRLATMTTTTTPKNAPLVISYFPLQQRYDRKSLERTGTK